MVKTAEKIVYNIRHILKKLNVKTDDVNDRALAERIPVYAHYWMNQSYNYRKRMEESWFLNLGLVDVEKVNSGDDPNVANGSVALSRYELPRIAEIGNNFLKVYNGIRNMTYTKIENFQMFFLIYKNDRRTLERNPCYVYQGGNIYIYPDNGLQISFIPANPFECMIRRELINPATNEILFSKNQLRPFGILDPYPISSDVEYNVTLDIIEKDYGQERNRIVDKMQDGNDEVQ